MNFDEFVESASALDAHKFKFDITNNSLVFEEWKVIHTSKDIWEVEADDEAQLTAEITGRPVKLKFTVTYDKVYRVPKVFINIFHLGIESFFF